MASPDERWREFEARIKNASTIANVDAIEQELFGRKSGAFTVALKGLATATLDEKRMLGPTLHQWKATLEQAITAKRQELLSTPDTSDRIDVTLSLPERERGHLHLIPEFIRDVEGVFGRMGFDVFRGPEVETEDYNFNLLNIPETHPARDAQDTFWIDPETAPDKKNRWVLRTHTSPGQIRYMQTHKPPFRMVCTGKVYRKDADATHSPMFHQFEGLMVGKDVSLANMKAVMIAAMRELISLKAVFRFRTGFFPFVEPGLEVDMKWQGDASSSREGDWLEVVGCGMVHPNVLKNVGIDPEKWQGFAFGFGVERMIMIKHQIPDLRSFYEGDLRFLRQF
jgi:phenylalanyl-tRNA synthetase alpha chain